MKKQKRLRKLWSVILTLALVLTSIHLAPVMSVKAAAETDGSGITGDCSWSYSSSTHTLTISGTGKMADYGKTNNKPDWRSVPTIYSYATGINIESGVQYIGNASFYSFAKMISDKTVDIPNTVTSIGAYAFYGSGSYDYRSTIIIPSSVVSIGDEAFWKGDGNYPTLYNNSSIELVPGKHYSPATTYSATTIYVPLNVTTDEHCTCTPSGTTSNGSYQAGTTTTLTLSPNAGYVVSGVKVNGIAATVSGNTCTFSTPTYATKIDVTTVPDHSMVTYKGDYVGSESVAYAGEVTLPTAPAGYAYDFTLPDNSTFTGNNITGDVTVTVTKKINSGTVTIKGTPEYGQTLTAEAAEFPADSGTLSYQWYRDTTQITGGTGQTYQLITDDIGKSISVKVKASVCSGTRDSAGVTIGKATPEYTILTGLTATYGQKLSDVTLPTATNGVFSWQDSSSSVGNYGTNSFMVTFTPNDTTHYKTVDSTITINVIPPTTYTVTVNGGTGTGAYAEGDTVAITATVPSGKQFKNWTSEDATFLSSTSINTTFTMPAKAVSITANFEDIPVISPTTYAVTVNGGTGTGAYAEGNIVAITATVPSGKQFKNWTSEDVTFASATSTNTTFTMPAKAVSITANFEDIPVIPPTTYTVTVNAGTGTGAYAEGDTVAITATVPSGKQFKNWTSGDVTLLGSTSINTTFTMPAKAVSVTANFEDIPVISPTTYAVTVNGGTGTGIYAEGNIVAITATVPSGKQFENWTSGDVTLLGSTSINTTFTMPAKAVSVTANFEDIPVIPPTPQPYIPPYVPPTPQEETREISVVVDNGGVQNNAVQVPVTRTTDSDGTKKDMVKFDEEKAKETVAKALETKTDTATINLTDIPGNNADKVEVQVPQTSMTQLGINNIGLDVKTEKAALELPKETVSGLKDKDTKIQISEVKDSSEVAETKGLIIKLASGSEVIATPLKIEANYTGRTKITLPIDASKLPSSKEELDKSLSSLAVMVQHSDGENVIDKGTIVYDENGKLIGISIWVNKFSTFTLVELPNNYFDGRTTIMPGKVAPDKEWNIIFTKEADKNTLTSENVYVLDSAENKVDVKISYNSDNILRIAPVNNYKSGETYYLYISNKVTSKNKTSLPKALKFQFTIK